MNDETRKRIKENMSLMRNLVWCSHDASKVCDECKKGITGDLTGIRGNLTGITGNLTGIKGDLSDITGDLTGITGNLTGINATADEIREVLKEE